MPNDCPLGQEFRNGACQWCSGGSIKPDGTERCVQCSDGEKTVANVARTECITKQQCESIAGAAVVNKVCVCTEVGTAINNAGNACVRCGASEVPNGVGSACVCADGYGVDQDGVCKKCSIGTVHHEDPNENERKPCGKQKQTILRNIADTCTVFPYKNLCITRDGCYWKNNQCSSCTGASPVANIAKNDCVSEAHCQESKGSVYEDDGRKQCKCAPGFKINSSSNACEQCPEGQISSSVNQSTCSTCSSPNVANPQRSGCISRQVCMNTQGFPDVRLCKCLEGFFVRETSDSFKCRQCNETEQINSVSQTCICKPAYGIRSSTSFNCEQCSPGSYSNPGNYDTEKLPCKVCSGDDYVSNLAQNGCQTRDQCRNTELKTEPDNKQCYCIPGWGRGLNNSCVECIGNQISSRPSLECNLCKNVTEIANNSHTICLCAAGYGVTDNDPITCSSCPQGTEHIANPNETSKQKCKPIVPTCGNHEMLDEQNNTCVCTAGYEMDTDSNCKLCDEGQFKEAAGNETCKSCATDGSEISNETRTACICSEGFGVSGNACVKCPAGTFHTSDSRETQKVQCEKCPAGSYSESGSQVCQPCNGNSVSSEEGSVGCTSCENDLIPNKEKTRCIDAEIARTSSNPTSVIAGCVVALLALIALIAALIIILRKRGNSFGKKGVNNINRTNYYNERVRKNVSAKDDQGKRMHQQPDTSKVLMSQNNGLGRNKAQINRKKEQHGAAKRSAFIVGATDGRV